MNKKIVSGLIIELKIETECPKCGLEFIELKNKRQSSVELTIKETEESLYGKRFLIADCECPKCKKRFETNISV